jgi:hypothetical protein
MRRPQDQFLDKTVNVVFAEGVVTGVLEAIGDDGSLLLRQGPRPVWVPLHQVRYVTLAEVPMSDEWEPE